MIAKPEKAYQRRLLPTKSIEVSPRYNRPPMPESELMPLTLRVF